MAALISATFSFLLRLSEVKHHWSKSAKLRENFQSIIFDEERLDPHGVGYLHEKSQS